MIKALLLDFSGTILDDFEKIYAVSVAAGKEFGVALPELEDLRRTHSTDWRGFWEKKLGSKDKATKLIKRWVEIYGFLEGNEKLFDGAREFLLKMREQYLLGIVTSNWKKLTLATFEKFDIDPLLFSSIITPDTTQRLKPDPHMIELCCEELGVKPSEAVFIGDMTQDIEAGKGAGVKTVAVSWGWHENEDLKQENPDFLAESWADIEKWLEAQK